MNLFFLKRETACERVGGRVGSERCIRGRRMVDEDGAMSAAGNHVEAGAERDQC